MADTTAVDGDAVNSRVTALTRHTDAIAASSAPLKSRVADARFTVRPIAAGADGLMHTSAQLGKLSRELSQIHAKNAAAMAGTGTAIPVPEATPVPAPAPSMAQPKLSKEKIKAVVAAYGEYLDSKKATAPVRRTTRRIHRSARGGHRSSGGSISGKYLGAGPGVKTTGGIARGAISEAEVATNKTGLPPLNSSQLNAVIAQALTNNGITDPHVRKQWGGLLVFMAEKESSNNPDAVNCWDSNAHGAPKSDGAPGMSSRGIWQTIPPTFASNHVEGTSNNIYDPVACGSAAVRYIMRRYGVAADGTGLDAFLARRRANGYTGY